MKKRTYFLFPTLKIFMVNVEQPLCLICCVWVRVFFYLFSLLINIECCESQWKGHNTNPKPSSAVGITREKGNYLQKEVFYVLSLLMFLWYLNIRHWIKIQLHFHYVKPTKCHKKTKKKIKRKYTFLNNWIEFVIALQRMKWFVIDK